MGTQPWACLAPPQSSLLPTPKQFLEGWLLPRRMEGTLGVLSQWISLDSSILPVHLSGFTLGCCAPDHIDSPDP